MSGIKNAWQGKIGIHITKNDRYIERSICQSYENWII